MDTVQHLCARGHREQCRAQRRVCGCDDTTVVLCIIGIDLVELRAQIG